MSLEKRFHAKYDRQGDDDCWLWTAATTDTGYGVMQVDGRLNYAHRLSYQIHNGPITGNLCVLHRCDVRSCVNPNHLFLGTRGDNIYDMIEKRRDRFCSTVAVKDKIDPMAVPLVKYLADSGEFPMTQIADAFGISESLVSRIKSGEAYIVRVA